MDKFIYIIAVFLVFLFTSVGMCFLYCIVRSIQKKPLNIPPSEKKWEKCIAKQLSHEYITYQNFRPPRTVNKLKYIVEYQYSGRYYTTKIDGYTLKKRKAVIYCKKKSPTIAKEYIPVQPLGISAIIGMLFIVGFIIVCEGVFIAEFFCK